LWDTYDCRLASLTRTTMKIRDLADCALRICQAD
jgi:hypothetical protein